MGLFSFLVGLFGGSVKFPARPKKTRQHRMRIEYLVFFEGKHEDNDLPTCTFKSGRNAHSFAKRLRRKTGKTIKVFKVDGNGYSLGMGDTIDVYRYGIFKEWTYKGNS